MVSVVVSSHKPWLFNIHIFLGGKLENLKDHLILRIVIFKKLQKLRLLRFFIRFFIESL
jgi:hypothetical protein